MSYSARRVPTHLHYHSVRFHNETARRHIVVMGTRSRSAPAQRRLRWPTQVALVLAAWSALAAVGVIAAAHAWT
jgi:hypothetical protein